VENYVTYFDHNFLLQGMALHESLRRQQADSKLWVLCLDEEVEIQLKVLRLVGLRTISLQAIETPELVEAKRNRSRTEYIFTLTPFIFEFVYAQDRAIDRVTYLDADIYFYKNPMLLLQPFIDSNKSVLVTDHAYGPEYSHLAAQYGTFCVQFMTVKKTAVGLYVIRAWQRQCLEDCAIPRHGGKQVFGDQKYLEDWPQKHSDAIYILPEREESLAPWNVNHYQRKFGRQYYPVFYHFQSYRVFHRKWIQLCFGFDIRLGEHLYKSYIEALGRQSTRLGGEGIACPIAPFKGDKLWLLRLFWRILTGQVVLKRYSLADFHLKV
jgi:hypothetical protein